MKKAKTASKKKYMSDEDFAGLMTSLNQALAFSKGESTGGRITVRHAPQPPRPRGRKDVARIRKRLNFSQGMFASVLNVSPRTVQAWEAGRRTPSDAALKLLAIAEKHPEDLLDSV